MHRNNLAWKKTTCYFYNNSYSRCLIKLPKFYNDNIRLKSNYGNQSNTSTNKNKKRVINPFLKDARSFNSQD